MTAEEKLLRLIRKKGPPSEPKKPAAPSSPSKENSQEPREPMGIDVLRWANQFLVVLCLGITIYLVADHFKEEKQNVLIPEERKRVEEALPQIIERARIEVKPFEVYKDTISQRDVFLAPWEKSEIPTGGVGESAQEFKRQYKLVGIVMDQQPKAILEDSKTQISLFVIRGEKIGEGVVEEIQEGKVVVSLGGEKIEFTP